MEPAFVDWYASLVGGLVGTIAMVTAWYAMRAAGWMKLDPGQLFGSYLLPPGRRALAVGLTPSTAGCSSPRASPRRG